VVFINVKSLSAGAVVHVIIHQMQQSWCQCFAPILELTQVSGLTQGVQVKCVPYLSALQVCS